MNVARRTDVISSHQPLVILDKVMRIEGVGEGRYDIGVAFTAVDSDHRLALKKYFENAKEVMAAHMAWMKDPILITLTNKEKKSKKTKNDSDVAGYFLRFQGFKVRVG